MRRALRLARSHDFVIYQETHGNDGKASALKLPSNLRAFWNHGTNHQAGLALFVNAAFLEKFNPSWNPSWSPSWNSS